MSDEADDWCEINGGGVVTPDQIIEMQKRQIARLRAALDVVPAPITPEAIEWGHQVFAEDYERVRAENERLRAVLRKVRGHVDHIKWHGLRPETCAPGEKERAAKMVAEIDEVLGRMEAVSA